MIWTEARITELTELWECNCPTGEIGRIMGLTKGQIIGKAHRLELPGRPSPIRPRQKPKPKPLPLPPAVTLEARLRELWPHRTMTAIAEDLGVSRNRVSRMAKMLDLPRRNLAPGPRFWTPERVDGLTRMHSAGALDNEIGDRLGTTGSAVRNKLSDLGLLRPSKPPVQRRERGYIAPALSRPVPISRHRTCQFIAGEPSADDACKCGDPAQLGSSFCPEHHAVCWQTLPKASAA